MGPPMHKGVCTLTFGANSPALYSTRTRWGQRPRPLRPLRAYRFRSERAPTSTGPMNRFKRGLGRNSLELYRLSRALARERFSLTCSGEFAAFGARSVIQPPVRLLGADGIAVGSDVFIGANAFLQVIEHPQGAGRIEIGDGVSITGDCVLSSAARITLGRKVLIARNVYIADHRHAFDDPAIAILDQGLEQIEPIEIGDGAWLGQNVVVGPGVTIGRGAVVGANSVVLRDVPARSVAVGAPARVVRELETTAARPSGAKAEPRMTN